MFDLIRTRQNIDDNKSQLDAVINTNQTDNGDNNKNDQERDMNTNDETSTKAESTSDDDIEMVNVEAIDTLPKWKFNGCEGGVSESALAFDSDSDDYNEDEDSSMKYIGDVNDPNLAGDDMNNPVEMQPNHDAETEQLEIILGDIVGAVDDNDKNINVKKIQVP